MLTFPLAVTERTPPPSIRNKKFRTSDHLTAFSILLDPTPRERISKYHENILEQISYVGSVLSTRTILSPNRIISTPKSILHRKKRKFTNFPISFSQRRGGGDGDELDPADKVQEEVNHRANDVIVNVTIPQTIVAR